MEISVTKLRIRVQLLRQRVAAADAEDLELGLDLLDVYGRRVEQLRAQLVQGERELAVREGQDRARGGC